MSVTLEFPSNLERKLYYTLWPELQHGDIWLRNRGGVIVGEIKAYKLIEFFFGAT